MKTHKIPSPQTAEMGEDPLGERLGKPLTEEEELYKENILDHYRSPHNKGQLKKYTQTHSDLNPLCGDRITIYLQVSPNSPKILTDISFEGSGCAISQAAASLLTDNIKGKKVEEIRNLGPWDVFNLLGIRISHTRSKCALLSLKTIQHGLQGVK